MSHYISASLLVNNDQPHPVDEKYELVDHILSASDYYEALELSQDATLDEIRRAYIKKSRICHPDKFVPPYPKATKSFQILSEAYKTLSQPSSYVIKENAVDVFQQMIQKLYAELMDGEFQTLRTVIHVMNDANGVVHISDEVLDVAETGFLKIKDIVTGSQKYYDLVQFELLRLYDLHDEIRNLGYLQVWRRFTLAMDIAKIIIQIPLLVNRAVKQEQCNSGVLGVQAESCLEKAICLFDKI